MDSLMLGLFVALIAMFVLLTIEFRSYVQPLIIMAIIPFGIIGAIWGHFVQGMEITMFSLFGIVALTGVVVNDAIVLIDFINLRVRAGTPLREALLDAGVQRLRPVFLTSVTTVAGLLPILLERSFQAQIVIPMATSLCFGLMLATVLVLYLVPALYKVYAAVAPAAAGTLHGNVEEDQSRFHEPLGSASAASVELIDEFASATDTAADREAISAQPADHRLGQSR
jgi:multidrug efflux pump subunit AcrB